jgi:hypothetical protein
MSELGKSRDLPIGDYFSILQIEYICSAFRAKIYNREFDRKMFNDICKRKKEKIDSIAFRNKLPSIFDNENSKTKYINKFFPEWGLPNFQYRNKGQENSRGLWDKRHYFEIGSSVKIKNKGKVDLGYIVAHDIDNSQITVTIKDEKEEVVLDYENVSRIIPSDFFDNFN